jgi:hypothetical protein
MKDGKPAFPTQGFLGYSHRGMSLRDYFAGQALAGFPESAHKGAVKGADATGLEYEGVLSELAYGVADAMLKVREEGE